MTTNENLQTRYIPMEVTSETIKDFGIDASKVKWARIGNKPIRVIKVAATEEQYEAYMRPLWREDKRRQRHGDDLSTDKLYKDNELADQGTDIAGDIIKKELIMELRRSLAELEDLDQTIMGMFANGSSEADIGKAVGMSQRGVGKRKQRVLLKLRNRLEAYR